MIGLLLLQLGISVMSQLPKQGESDQRSLAYLQVSETNLVVSVPNIPCLKSLKAQGIKATSAAWAQCPEPMFVDVGLLGGKYIIRVNRETGETTKVPLIH